MQQINQYLFIMYLIHHEKNMASLARIDLIMTVLQQTAKTVSMSSASHIFGLSVLK